MQQGCRTASLDGRGWYAAQPAASMLGGEKGCTPQNTFLHASISLTASGVKYIVYFGPIQRHLRGVGAARPPGAARVVGAVAGVPPAAAATMSCLHVRDHLLVCSACISLQAAEVDF